MARILYTVSPAAEQWAVTRDGEPGMSYVTQEAAFEVAVAEAEGDLRAGHEITLEVRTRLAHPVDDRGGARR
jgi:hypothetical protein